MTKEPRVNVFREDEVPHVVPSNRGERRAKAFRKKAIRPVWSKGKK